MDNVAKQRKSSFDGVETTINIPPPAGVYNSLENTHNMSKLLIEDGEQQIEKGTTTKR